MSDLLKACQGTAALPEESKHLLRFYPNPASNQLYVTASEKVERLNLYNAMGVLVGIIPVNGQQGVLEIGNYSSGIYFIGADSFTHAEKLLIQK
jgi:hypothetical protein